MKKLLSIILIICLSLSAFCTSFAEEKTDETTENVIEISFKVGDETLKVNNKNMTVEKPYVINGTTLVPLRVISEAFGAEVNWNGEDKSITLVYSDVTIKLAIGDVNAYINDAQQELLAAPELTNNTTMVPLRFITENFGADVSYDDETKAIKVIKELTESNSILDYSLLLKKSTKDFVGDSFYGWSMERSPQLKLTERSFDGAYNEFSHSDTGATILVEVYNHDDETIDEIYSGFREESQSYTTSKLEKATAASGAEYAYIQYKDQNYYNDIRTFIYNNKIIEVYLYMSLENDKADFENMVKLVSTFDFAFDKQKSEDLSDVNPETGMHRYISKNINLEIDIPGDFYIIENKNRPTDVTFYRVTSTTKSNLDRDYIHINVYSKENNKGAQSWAEEDLLGNKSLLNSEYTKFSGILNVNYAGQNGYMYSFTTSYNGEEKSTHDFFFEKGDYIYNLAVTSGPNDVTQIAETVFGSLSVGEIDTDEVGIILRTEEEEITYKEYSVTGLNMKLNLPTEWYTDSGSTSLSSVGSMMLVGVNSVLKSSFSHNVKLDEFVSAYKSSIREQTIVKSITDSVKKVNDTGSLQFVTKIENEDQSYTMVYHTILETSKYYAVVTFTVPEFYDGEYATKIHNTILDSITYK